MLVPVPEGMRDVLPAEMGELRLLTTALRESFAAAAYEEIYTPAFEYESVIETGGCAAVESPYRLFDDDGRVLVPRPDMTVPIARVAATRCADVGLPLRFSYAAHTYRVQGGAPAEVLQAGIELIGAPAPGGTAEVIGVLCRTLQIVGLSDFCVVIGDAALYPTLMDELSVPEDARAALLYELVTRDFVGLRREVMALTLEEQARELLIGLPQIRGGIEELEKMESQAVKNSLAGLRSVQQELDESVSGRLMIDLGLSRQLDYYTGAIFEVFDAPSEVSLGGGGRYDELVGKFGRDLPAVGFSLDVEPLHLATRRGQA